MLPENLTPRSRTVTKRPEKRGRTFLGYRLTNLMCVLLAVSLGGNAVLLSNLAFKGGGKTSITEKPSAKAVQNSLNGSISKALSTTTEEVADHVAPVQAGNRVMLVLDLWERMVNMQSGFKRLVQIGIDADFKVVEPFVYESRISSAFAFPEQFHARNLTPQPLSTYFSTSELYTSKHFMSYETFREDSLGARSGRAVGRTEPQPVWIDAVLQIDWNQRHATENAIHSWCNDILKRLPRKTIHSYQGWMLRDSVMVGGAVCVPAGSISTPGNFTAAFFNTLYNDVARKFSKYGSLEENRRRKQVSIALLNYRKHGFSGYTSTFGSQPALTKMQAMRVGQEPRRIAQRMHHMELKSQPYVALQIRTGKAWVLSGFNVTRFSTWLDACVDEAIGGVKLLLMDLKSPGGVYLASDMFNKGWKGGEDCPPEVRTLLNAAISRLWARLGTVVRFVPTQYGVSQDEMGMAGVVDAAMCVRASRFIFVMPSSFGQWIDDQRQLKHMHPTLKIKCKL